MTYRQMWEIDVRHNGLHKYRHIRGSDKRVVEEKARAQELAWEAEWQKRQLAEGKRRQKEAQARSKGQKKELAAERTAEAQERLREVESVLELGTAQSGPVDWEALLETEEFPEPRPSQPSPEVVPRRPEQRDEGYRPKLGLWGKLFPSIRARKQQEAEDHFSADLKKWEEERDRIEATNADAAKQHAEKLASWKAAKEQYEKEQGERNSATLEKKSKYFAGDPDEVADYCELVLAASTYPDDFPQQWEVDFHSESKLLIVDYALPEPATLPTVKEVRYVASKDEFKVSELSAGQLNKIYDRLLYEIALRTIHELLAADSVGALAAVVFNGWVEASDRATGQRVNSCILSVQTSKEEFSKLNLAAVEPKQCFRALKGVGSSKLHGLAPVAPIATINREDRRFVQAYEVADGISESDNLAAMDWQDFENLIRELFEQEFGGDGSEVKITQASRDGGVDAIAFDADPVRGGKIVIQAKRYTNVVGVSAVRDLYGTTLNEGAMKGILVTTAEYGPDAYEFAKGKPLTLLNGGNLLSLLEKHGHRARINLAEAKSMLMNSGPGKQ